MAATVGAHAAMAFVARSIAEHFSLLVARVVGNELGMVRMLRITAAALVCVAAIGCKDTLSFGGGSSSSSGTGSSGATCSTNQECVDQNAGQPSICRSGACVALLSEDCVRVYGDSADDAAIVIGAMAPLTGAAAPSGQVFSLAIDLAQDEIRKSANGLPPNGLPGANNPRRPLAVVVCDEAADPVRAAKHLVDDVGVPAIIGPISDAAVMAVATQVTIPSSVFLLAPLDESPLLGGLADDGLVWQGICSASLQTSAFPSQVAELEQDVRAALALPPSQPIKLALANGNDTWDSALATQTVATVAFNGAPAVSTANSAYFLQVTYDPMGDLSPAISEVAAFAPQLATLFAQSDGPALLSGIETASLAPPQYLLPHEFARADSLAVIGDNDAFRNRIRGTRCAPPVGPVALDLKLRFEAPFPGVPMDPAIVPYAYDAMYVVAYSIVAAGNVPMLDGKAIASGMAKLVPPGLAIDVGPSNLNEAFTALAAGGNIDLGGASGTLDFDLQTGAPVDPIDIWCVQRDAQGAPIAASSGEVYDPKTGTTTGTFACP